MTVIVGARSGGNRSSASSSRTIGFGGGGVMGGDGGTGIPRSSFMQVCHVLWGTDRGSERLELMCWSKSKIRGSSCPGGLRVLFLAKCRCWVVALTEIYMWYHHAVHA